MKYLGVDFGTKRVGIATADDQGGMSFPLRVIPYSKNLWRDILEICLNEKAEAIVIGKSVNFQNEENPVMKKISLLKKELEIADNLPVFLHTEVLSSQEAKLIQGENEMHDASAAAIILQSYLDYKHHSVQQENEK